MRDMSKQDSDHRRYMLHRDERCKYQREYYAAHKEELKEKRRERNFIKNYVENKKHASKTRQEINHDYYVRHREEILAKRRNYERRETRNNGDTFA
jgi:hypothetical protein